VGLFSIIGKVASKVGSFLAPAAKAATPAIKALGTAGTVASVASLAGGALAGRASAPGPIFREGQAYKKRRRKKKGLTGKEIQQLMVMNAISPGFLKSPMGQMAIMKKGDLF